MRRRIRRFAVVLGVLVFGALGVGAGTTAIGSALAAPPLAQPATVIDGFAFGHLPGGIGHRSDFAYEFERVTFAARVWESRTEGGWRVDLDIDVMRGRRLSDADALHDWFIRYEDRQPRVGYLRTSIHGHPGWLGRDQAFWLQEPGVAVSVRLDGARWSTLEVARTAWSAREAG